MTQANLILLGIVAVLVFIVSALMLSGFYSVKPGEAAAVQTWGAAKSDPVSREGLHWHWPWPIGTVTVVQVAKSRTATIGFFYLPEGVLGVGTNENWERNLQDARMIAGDLSLLEVQVVAQYYISNLNDYLFRADDPGVSIEYLNADGAATIYESHPEGRPDGQSIQDALNIAVRRSVGQRTIDDVLVLARESIERETLGHAQDILDSYETGLRLTSIQLQETRPPEQVKDAFDDVLRAREERDTRINQALVFESEVLPKARGEAAKAVQEAEAYKATRIAEAEAEATRFNAILQEYKASPEVVRDRMYLETMDKVLPRLNQIFVGGVENPVFILGGAGIVPLPAREE